jgi:hypothetical protein
VTTTADASDAEFIDRRLRRKRDSGEAFGMTYATLLAINSAVAILSAYIAFVNCLNVPMIVVQLVFGTIYARKLSSATQRLTRDSDDQGDDYDDDPKPRRKPKKPSDEDFEEFDEPGHNPRRGDR